jgi:hypothetical protein
VVDFIFVLHKINTKMMTIQEVAKRYYDLAQTGQYAQMQQELYSPDALSIESENNSNLPIMVKGFEAMKQKEGQFFQIFDAVHGGYCGEPLISSHFFVCASGMDVTVKGVRKMKEQIGVFEVENGQIIKEQFFYNDFV